MEKNEGSGRCRQINERLLLPIIVLRVIYSYVNCAISHRKKKRKRAKDILSAVTELSGNTEEIYILIRNLKVNRLNQCHL